MGKIILNLAISLDGYICDENGGYDWIVGHGERENNGMGAYDFDKFIAGIDTIVMGSIAYKDVVLSGLTTYDEKEIIVASHQSLDRKENVTFISGDICSKVLELKELYSKSIWLFGGAGLTDSFIRANIVDEYVIAVIPTILGNGRRLFKGDYPQINLHLDEYTINDGIVVLTYTKR